MPKLTVDGRPVEVEAGQTVMNAAEKLGIEIPRFCYHSKLPVAGNCRMCLVEVEKMPKLTTSCTTPATEGMVVLTKSPKVKEGQKAVLEYLLINHPLDCPVCDKAGECDLQDQYFAFSSTPSRMIDQKVHKPKRIELGPTIKLDQERCVLCTRCVRFLEVYAHDHSLGTVNRGDRAILTVFPGRPLDNIYSLNTVDLCPVGALTSKDFRFKKRVWFLKNADSVCTFCSNQCSTVVQHDEGTIYRILPRENEKVNGPWMCDTGRLEYRFINAEERVKCPMVRRDEGQERTTWREAMEAVGAAFKAAGSRAAGLASPRMTNESLFAFAKLFVETLGSKLAGFVKADAGLVEGAPADDFLIKADKNPNTRGAEEIFAAWGVEVDGARSVLEAAEGGKLAALLVMDQALLERVPNRERWLKALAKVKFVAVASLAENELTRLAHVVLPLASWAEEEGTYTRFDGLVQRSWRAVPPRGEAKDALGLLSQVAVAAGKQALPLVAEAVFKALVAKVRCFGSLTYAAIGKQGAKAGSGAATHKVEIVNLAKDKGAGGAEARTW
ncbi:MAG: (2Fe-2S)-binding protein [Candidatus Wallbacteria bacterium]|nr:(2Fe-2S)-binding protein [Candidatus Wallbacteria bacterium]